MSEEFQLKPVSFSPEVLARIAPELSLQRHLSVGVRPCLRSFQEFKSVQINPQLDSINRYTSNQGISSKSTVLGSSNIKCGNTIIFCTITGGFIETLLPNDEADENVKEYEKIYENSEKQENNQQDDSLSNFRTVYPIIEIERGRTGAPTDEEMIISQTLHDTLLNSKILPKESLEIDLGLKTVDKDNNEIIIYPNESKDIDSSLFQFPRKYSFVLYASIQVFSRSGPILDAAWLALMIALKSTKLPCVYFDEKNSNLLNDISSLSSKKSVKTGVVNAKSGSQIICDPTKSHDLKLNNSDLYTTTIGLIELDKDFSVEIEDVENNEDFKALSVDKHTRNEGEPILLCDIEGDAEENAIGSRVVVIPDINTEDDDNLVSVTIIGGGSKVTKQSIQNSIGLAKLRSKNLQQQS
ncbi:exosome non-catalytic core subunit [Saccharomycopsis crataegensis]|uniref:Ribosomal RNA-processing protein 43 n=1 Tax=Saccharomycopsis crataegensis TaxID=43959 RepID=A0AAV5QNQ6_9ASCO|nr:exosome non-catalytic core subunit [Saccharomycopsis crataegensis]